MAFLKIGNQGPPANLLQAIERNAIVPPRTLCLQRVVAAGEIFLDYEANCARAESYVVGSTFWHTLAKQFIVARYEFSGTRPPWQRPSFSPMPKIEASAPGPIDKTVDVAHPDRDHLAPQNLIEGIPPGADASTVIAIGKIIECRIESKPVPHANTVDDLRLWQAIGLDQLQKF